MARAVDTRSRAQGAGPEFARVARVNNIRLRDLRTNRVLSGRTKDTIICGYGIRARVFSIEDLYATRIAKNFTLGYAYNRR